MKYRKRIDKLIIEHLNAKKIYLTIKWRIKIIKIKLTTLKKIVGVENRMNP